AAGVAPRPGPPAGAAVPLRRADDPGHRHTAGSSAAGGVVEGEVRGALRSVRPSALAHDREKRRGPLLSGEKRPAARELLEEGDTPDSGAIRPALAGL